MIRVCDCYVSLHRSEDYGRGMAEAMFLCKPVIATGYSGNLGFMNKENSLLLPYRLIEVEDNQYPHAEGQVWAEADVEQAVEHMKKLVLDSNYGKRLGEKASRSMRTHFSYRAVGLKYMQRLDYLVK